MSLSDRELLIALRRKQMRITPFLFSALGPAGYDLRSLRTVRIRPRQFALVATLERVEVGSRFLGLLHLRSSFAREGVLASLALVDPGFRGQLTIALFNANARKTVVLRAGERFLQISFVRLGRASRRGYGGRYQNSIDVVGSRRSDPSENV
jgi:dCTP deaminase